MGRSSTEVNLENCTLEEFERTMSCTLSQEDYRRLEAVWFLYRGYSRDYPINCVSDGLTIKPPFD